MKAGGLTERLERWAFTILPIAVLAVAYAGICSVAGSAWPWNRIVHEDGRRTLLETIFFVEHATRELVPDLLLAVAVAGAVQYLYPFQPLNLREASRRRRWCAVTAAISLVVIVGGTVATEGFGSLLDNLQQLHTREGAPLVWGAHWRYHLIERFAQMLLAFCLVGIIWVVDGRPAIADGPGRRTLLRAAFVGFALLTLLFRPTIEPFTEPAFLGHQLRELFTHALVTLPLSLGVTLGLGHAFAGRHNSGSYVSVTPIVLAGVSSVLCGVFLLAASVLTGAQSHGQTTSLPALLFPHFAEHGLGYVLVPSVAGLLYLWPRHQSGV